MKYVIIEQVPPLNPWWQFWKSSPLLDISRTIYRVCGGKLHNIFTQLQSLPQTFGPLPSADAEHLAQSLSYLGAHVSVAEIPPE
ncbi:MAG: hypothetical protein C7B47_17650 [Sulfobacillus thermosulfidooxidans]|uniref:Uncharacterized protein n=1 Tax=Sulfobacillus thermosulfidooxidans TaxID=28034 RepID=A0A2T2WF96_SULTH|nr:MAG: hypothetical protein C7B47_17650 [Sulfobacillus thermosulfidooxidans]